MRDRQLAPAALVAGIVCCAAMALVTGVAGGVALALLGRFTLVSVAGLGVVVTIAWQLDRRRQRPHRIAATSDRPTDRQRAAR